MTTMLAAVALLCGIPVGVVIGLVLGLRMRNAVVREDEFDGGYKLENPPVRTIIWSKDIDQK